MFSVGCLHVSPLKCNVVFGFDPSRQQNTTKTFRSREEGGAFQGASCGGGGHRVYFAEAGPGVYMVTLLIC